MRDKGPREVMEAEAQLRKPWSTRIPAAIAKAKEHRCDDWPCTHLTREEIDLAEALLGMWEAAQEIYKSERPGRTFNFEPHEALRAFCEKIEAL